ncbi:threonine synthase [Engelhardtia mirabilis]|uniref:Threonine synthase n=1 Tax=Engelhardtia mirabilis TaxID=2528011 RepID=A0A518BEY7_9BACT|nr:Threonine synthase [Planctomycetes bacterium Pla133]QDU99848.1 Threonine synthase [Planctomycetes bacterium Pla86]
MASYATWLESSIDGTRLELDRLQSMHAGRPLLVRYDLERARREVRREVLAGRERDLWRYGELLPVQRRENIVSLGEQATPLLACPRLGAQLGLEHLTIKDESHLPTGSFKSRGMALAVSRAKELGVTRLALPTAGNAGGAAAAYAARAGLECYVFMPKDTPLVNRLEAGLHGAKAFLVDGLIDDCGKVVREGAEAMGWFDLSTLKEPYRLEGKKTMGLELCEQLDWTLPDVILYPTGGGTGLVGMWKAFDELARLGWLEGEWADGRRPRLFACQSAGCAPIVRAFDAGERHALRFENAATVASGLRVPAAVGDFLILDAVRASGGQARAVAEERLLPWMFRASSAEGLGICPETAACFAVLEDLVNEGVVSPESRVVVWNTGAAQKYVEALEAPLPELPALGDIDWAAL